MALDGKPQLEGINALGVELRLAADPGASGTFDVWFTRLPPLCAWAGWVSTGL